MNDNSQRWITLFACMLASMCAGFAYAWSVLLKPLVSMYNWSTADVSLSFTLIMSTAAITAIFAGKALDYLPPRQVILFGGILFGIGIAGIGFIHSLSQFYMCVIVAGIGLGSVYPGGSMSNLVRFFPDKRGLVSGMLSAGYGLGAVIWAPITVALIAGFGFSNALKIMGILFFLVIAVFSRVVKTAPEYYTPKGLKLAKNAPQGTDTIDKDWKEMLRDPLFYLIAATLTLGEITGMMIVGHASPIAQEMHNMTPQLAAGIVGLLAIANTGGRVFWGWISDKIGYYNVAGFLFVLGGAAMAALTSVTSYYAFGCMIAVIGLCYGGFLALMAPITADLFGPKNLGVNFGIMFLSIAIAAYVGPLLASVVKEADNGDYSIAFWIAVIFNLAGFVLFRLFMFFKNRQEISIQKAGPSTLAG